MDQTSCSGGPGSLVRGEEASFIVSTNVYQTYSQNQIDLVKQIASLLEENTHNKWC